MKGGLSALGYAIGIVQGPRAVDAQPHQEVMLLEEPAPLLGQQRPVGLQVVLDRSALKPKLCR